jgi:branched-chain amino acid transport system ATP-binding protein
LALLEVRNLRKEFGGLVALKDLSLAIDEGEIVGLIGANGAGKSTMFHIVTGILKPTSGSVSFEGKEITGLKPHDIVRLGVSWTFQSVRPFLTYTVEENVRVGAVFGRTGSADAEGKVEEVLHMTGLDSKKGSIVDSLPIEQRKLVEVARALASSPRLLMLDEPMAGLNAVETENFIGLIRRVNASGVTVLVVEHVMKAIMSLSRRIVVLHAGQMLAEGTPEEVLANEEVIGVYLGASYVKS